MAEFENRDGGISQLNQMRALNYAFYRTGDERAVQVVENSLGNPDSVSFYKQMFETLSSIDMVEFPTKIPAGLDLDSSQLARHLETNMATTFVALQSLPKLRRDILLLGFEANLKESQVSQITGLSIEEVQDLALAAIREADNYVGTHDPVSFDIPGGEDQNILSAAVPDADVVEDVGDELEEEGDPAGELNINPVSLYLKDISQRPLLTAIQEIELAQQRDAREKAKIILALGENTPDEEDMLREEIGKGDEAVRTLIESNLRLVVSVARKYQGRGLTLLDLIQEGNVGLMRGVGKFEWQKGFRLSTYVYWWIRQATTRAIADQARTNRLPVHVIEQLTRFNHTADEISSQTGEPATAEQIAAELNMNPERVKEILRAAKAPISLSTPIGDDEDSTLEDLIRDRINLPPDEEGEAIKVAREFDEDLKAILTEREVEVLRMRFGLSFDIEEMEKEGEYIANKPKTLDQTGDEIELTRERARQIEKEALRKLRTDDNFKKKHRDYIDYLERVSKEKERKRAI